MNKYTLNESIVLLFVGTRLRFHHDVDLMWMQRMEVNEQVGEWNRKTDSIHNTNCTHIEAVQMINHKWFLE